MSKSVTLRPMEPDQYLAWRSHAENQYAQNLCTANVISAAEAREKAATDFGESLPAGLDSTGQHLLTAYDQELEVGMVWYGLTQKPEGSHAFGYALEVHEHLRRQGYGRAIMIAAEQLCKQHGVVSVGLEVAGFNAGARSLYEAMGFEVSSVQMKRML